MRMIDADSLKAQLIYLASHMQDNGHSTYAAAIGEAINIVDRRQTIDAVPVVRCKDCDHADHNILTSENFVYCNMWQTVSYGNGYCHHSARLDGEEVE